MLSKAEKGRLQGRIARDARALRLSIAVASPFGPICVSPCDAPWFACALLSLSFPFMRAAFRSVGAWPTPATPATQKG